MPKRIKSKALLPSAITKVTNRYKVGFSLTTIILYTLAIIGIVWYYRGVIDDNVNDKAKILAQENFQAMMVGLQINKP
jgi:hypothetical protein